MTALPNGHIMARGLKLAGLTGGLLGLGINCSHPERHDAGIQGMSWLHHRFKMAYKTGAIMSAVEFQVGPGAQGAATAFPVGISFSAATRSWMVKGTPVGGPGAGMGNGSPLQVSRTKAINRLLSSEGVMRWPWSLRS